MKKVCIIAMAALMLLTAQCKKNEPKPAEKVMVPISGTVDFGGGSKTEITTSGYITPVAGDVIYIYRGGDYVGYMSCTPTTGQQFNCSGEIDQDCLGYECTFMYLGSNNDINGQTSTTISFADQTGVSVVNGKISGIDKFHVGSCIAAVSQQGSVTLPMLTKMAIAYFQLKDEGGNAIASQSVTVSGIAATANIDKTNGTFAGLAGNITVRTDSEGRFYMALIPQNGSVTFNFASAGKQGQKNFPYGIRECNLYSDQGSGRPLQVTMTTTNIPVEGVTDGHSWINFNDQPGENFGVSGLPLWAKYNLGVNESNLTTAESYYGKYYAWGETKAYGETMSGDGAQAGQNYQPGAIKTDFQWTTYKWGNGRENMGKYSLSDGIDILSAEDDAANANWGDSWRMPSGRDYGMLEGGEWSELVENTYFQWVYNYNDKAGLNGFVVYKVKHADDKGLRTIDEKEDADNPEWRTVKGTDTDATLSATYTLHDPHMFLPAAGSYLTTFNLSAGYSGQYWSCMLGSLDTEDPDNDLYRAGSMWINPKLVGPDNVFARCAGLSVRPVIGVPYGGGNLTPYVPKPW